MIRHVGIADRFESEQVIKRWQRGEIEEVGRDTREHDAFAPNYGTEIEAEFPHRAAEAEQDVGTNQYGNKITGMTGPVQSEELRPLELDGYVPVDRTPPPRANDLDFEMGD